MARRVRKPYMIGVDIGGTKILTALLDKEFHVHAKYKVRVEANKGLKFFRQSLIDSIQKVCKKRDVDIKKDVRAIGMGCPGLIQIPEGIIRVCPNISFLKNHALKTTIQKALGVPVVLENDVNAGLYGEYHFGAARQAHSVFGIFLGTGVGGAMMLHGRLYRGFTGGAGEIGHSFLSTRALRCSESLGTVERFAGRLSIAAEAMYLIMKQKAPQLHALVGYDVRKVKSKVLKKSIELGDQAIHDLMIQKAEMVGLAMANVVSILSPELIILGGGLVEEMGDIIVPTARQTMRRHALAPLVHNVRVHTARLKDYAVVKGAARLADECVTPTLKKKRQIL